MKALALLLAATFCFSGLAAKKSARISKKDLRVLDATQKKGPDEKQVYASLIKAYRQDDLKKTKSMLEEMLSFHSSSIYADNALYLTGILQMKKGQLGPSIKSFDTVIRKYPKGNKRASALYAKGIAYKKLNLTKHARRHLVRVIKDYPGSVESKRAKVELRLLKKVKKPKSASL